MKNKRADGVADWMLLHGKSNHSIYFTHLVKCSIINVSMKSRICIAMD